LVWDGVDGKKSIRMTFTTPEGTEKSCDCVKKSTIEANHFKNLTWLMPNKSQEQTRDRVEKSTIAAKRLKNLAGDTRK
jgi:hypothetical protein